MKVKIITFDGRVREYGLPMSRLPGALVLEGRVFVHVAARGPMDIYRETEAAFVEGEALEESNEDEVNIL